MQQKRGEMTKKVQISKKGQVTLFVLLGIFLMIITGILIFFFSQKLPQQEATPLQTEAVTQLVEKCITKTAEEAILATGKRGGYFILPEQRTIDLREDVPYYKVDEQEFFPSVEERAEEIGKYIDTLLDFCLDFSIFEKQGYNVTVKPPQTKVILLEKDGGQENGKKEGGRESQLEIRTKLPLSFKKRLQTKKMESFRIKIPAEQLQEDFAVAQEIVKTQEQGAICLTCFSNLAEDNAVFVEVLPYYDNVYVYEITDKDYVLQNEKYVLRFAVKYGTENSR